MPFFLFIDSESFSSLFAFILRYVRMYTFMLLKVLHVLSCVITMFAFYFCVLVTFLVCPSVPFSFECFVASLKTTWEMVDLLCSNICDYNWIDKGNTQVHCGQEYMFSVLVWVYLCLYKLIRFLNVLSQSSQVRSG